MGLKVISPIKDLTDLGSEVQKVVEQRLDLKQRPLGVGANKAQVIMVGPVVVADSESVRDLLRQIMLEQKPEEVFENEPLEYLMAKILRNLPAPRMKNLEALARNVTREITATNTDAAKYLGVSVRTLRSHRDTDSQVKEIEDGA